MAQDEPQEKDVTFREQGVTFAIDKDLLEEVKPICVDFVESAGRSDFKISSSLPEAEDCGDSCGS
jgi:iron-sulfur cluster assembly protein